MANLEKLAANYRSEGYSALLAEARVSLRQNSSLKSAVKWIIIGVTSITWGLVLRIAISSSVNSFLAILFPSNSLALL